MRLPTPCTFSGVISAFVRKTIPGLAVPALLLIFAALPASADTLKTFTVATSGWAQLFQMCSPCPADPFPIDATSTITIDTSTGKLVASHVTASGTSPFGGTVPFSFQSQQSGSGYTLLTFSGSAAFSIQGNGTLTMQLNIYVPVASLVGYSGGPLCSPTNSCAGGFTVNTVEVIQCVGSNCTGSGAYTGTYTANAGQLTVTTVTNNPNAVPLIYPLVPSATAPGGPAFTLTVHGTGFVSGAAVNWNGTALTTTFVSSSQVTAAVPAANIATAGTAVVTVTNPALGGGTSNPVYFQITNPQTATSFTTLSNNEIDGFRARQSNTLVGNFAGSGKPDILAYDSGSIWVLPNNGDGSFTSGNWMGSPGPGGNGAQLASADLNGDGIPDVIISNSNGIFVALGKGNGRFQLVNGSLPAPGGFSADIVVADFNGDGFLDLAYIIPQTPSQPSSIQVQFGKGDGTFSAGPNTPFPIPPSGSSAPQYLQNILAVADFNGDGKLDLLATGVNLQDCIAGQVFVLEFPGNGDGSFGTPSGIPVGYGTCGSQGENAVVADFNGDGKLDFAYFNFPPAGPGGGLGFLSINLGNGDGTFRVPNLPLANIPQGSGGAPVVVGPVLAADFNGDGKPDLAVGNLVLYGNGDGSFRPAGSPNGNGLKVVQIADFNGDGEVDFLALGPNPSNSGQNDLRLLTQVPAAPDFGGGVTPASQIVAPGSSATYSGNIVALNGFTGNVALSASGLPTGATPTFNPTTVTGGSGSYTLTIGTSASTPVGAYPITITGTSGSLTHSSTVTLYVNSTPGDFSLSPSSSTDSYQNVTAGQSATYVVQVNPSGGFTGDVTLSLSGVGQFNGRTLPGTATFNPATIHGGSGTSTLTITTTSPTPVLDDYILTVTGSSGPLTHSGNVFLGIRNDGADFTGSITPSSQTITVGQSTAFIANITYLGGFLPTPGLGLTISVIGLPPGAQFSESGFSGRVGGETDGITISAPPGTPTGTYNLLLVGAGGGRIRRGAVTLTINP